MNHGKSGLIPLFLIKRIKQKRLTFRLLCFIVFVLSVAGLLGYGVSCLWQNKSAENTRKELQSLRQEADASVQDEMHFNEQGFPVEGIAAVLAKVYKDAGTGTKACDYADGTAPSTNLIIHGHTMRSGEMFGNLKLYQDAEYGAEHHLIRFDSLYEEREYELIAVFHSQVYYESDNVFKYYKFFQADTQKEFDDWYENIKAMSLYDTGITARFGDEFITLSCCSYHVEDGRFVVVGKRVK